MVGGTATSSPPSVSATSASISSTKSGFPPAARRIRACRPAEIVDPSSRRPISSSVSVSDSGSSKTLVAFSLPPPQVEWRSRSSGRAMQTRKIGASRERSATCSTSSRNVASPHCRSSTRQTTGCSAALASTSLRNAQAICAGVAATSASPRSSASVARTEPSSAASGPPACLTISTAGQYVMPSPYERQLAVATDHRDVDPADEPGRVRCDGEQPVRGDALALALQLERLNRLDRHGVADEAERLAAEEDLARPRRLLEPGSDVDGVAGREPVVRARDDLAGVHPESQLEPRREVAFENLVERAEPVSKLRRGADGAEGVVLVDAWDAEDGHDGVADELLDGAAVALDRRAGEVEVATENVAQAFGVESLAERSRAGDVGEEDGDGLSLLAVAGSVRAEGAAACVAEAGSFRILLAAVGARRHERRLFGSTGRHNSAGPQIRAPPLEREPTARGGRRRGRGRCPGE